MKGGESTGPECDPLVGGKKKRAAKKASKGSKKSKASKKSMKGGDRTDTQMILIDRS